MSKGDHGFTRKPRGSKVGGYARSRVQIGFDNEVLNSVSHWAKRNKRSFAAEIRTLVLEGLAARRAQ